MLEQPLAEWFIKFQISNFKISTVLEPLSPTISTGSARTLAHYIYWQCWNAGTLAHYIYCAGTLAYYMNRSLNHNTPTSIHLLAVQEPGLLHLPAVLEPWPTTSTGNAGALAHYIYWQCWNPGPLHLLAVLEPWSTTSTGNAGTLVHYIYWQCWNPGPLHLLCWNPGPLHLYWQCWNPGPLHLLAVLVRTLGHYIYWQCWNPGPLHLLAVLEPWSTTSTGSAGTLAHYIYW